MKNNRSASRRRRAGFTLIELLVVIAIIGILAAMIMSAVVGVNKAGHKMKAQAEAIDIANAINAYDSAYSRFPLTSDEVKAASQNGAANNDFTSGLVSNPQSGVTWPGGALGNNSFDNNNQIIAILMDLEKFPSGIATSNQFHIKNPKQTKFLAAKMSDYDPTSGGKPSPGVDKSGVYRDPWGNPYIITVDANYDDQASDLFYCQKAVSQSSNTEGYNGLFNTTDANGAGDNFRFHGKVMVWSAGPDGQIDRTLPANKGVNKDNILSWK